MTAPVCFVDTETTGLHPDRHQIWEVALITPDGAEHVWQFPVLNELDADPFALEVGHYWDRRWSQDAEVATSNAVFRASSPYARRTGFPDQGKAVPPSRGWCEHFRDLTAGCHLAGAVVSFDEERLRRLLQRYGVLHRWHYHLVDVEALAAGYLAGQWRGYANCGQRALVDPDDREAARPPWDSDQLSRRVGVIPTDFDRHTALGDAKWARAIYRAVLELPAL